MFDALVDTMLRAITDIVTGRPSPIPFAASTLQYAKPQGGGPHDGP